jgi:hypothetical protein
MYVPEQYDHLPDQLRAREPTYRRLGDEAGAFCCLLSETS